MNYISYIPIEIKDITEYKELNKAVNPTLTSVKSDMTSVFNNHFLSLLDEYGVKRMEKVMGIEGMESEPLDKRKLFIITKANNTLPYTIRNLKSKMIAILSNDGFSIYMDYGNYHLKIVLYVQNFDKLTYVREQIEGLIPCNVELELVVLYNQYEMFKKYTYGQLNSMTHQYMREHYFEEG